MSFERPSCACKPHGSADRIAGLYRRHRAAVRARCRRLLRDEAAADDALHETFLRAVCHAQHAPPGNQALHWLYRIASNYCLNELRRQRTAAATPFDEALSAAPSSLEAELANRDLARRVVGAVPEKLHVPALLKHVNGLLDAEVAAALGVARRTIVYRLEAFRDKATRLAATAAD